MLSAAFMCGVGCRIRVRALIDLCRNDLISTDALAGALTKGTLLMEHPMLDSMLAQFP